MRKAEEWLSSVAAHQGFDGAPGTATVGNPAYEIKGFASAKGADLIVIGSHGRHGVGRMLGSTANGVLHDAPCDVLAVRV